MLRLAGNNLILLSEKINTEFLHIVERERERGRESLLIACSNFYAYAKCIGVNICSVYTIDMIEIYNNLNNEPVCQVA